MSWAFVDGQVQKVYAVTGILPGTSATATAYKISSVSASSLHIQTPSFYFSPSLVTSLETGDYKFVWLYDLPVTVNQMAVGTGGSGLYKFLDCM